MNANQRLSGAALTLLLAAALAACGSSSATAPAATSAATQAATSAATQAGTSAPSGATTQSAVTISDFAFSPATITVAAGTKVTWTNQDSSPHTIVSDDGSTFKSERLANGASFSFTFTTAGTFAYHCGIHGSMTGKVIVTP
jgi:plastocyanin